MSPTEVRQIADKNGSRVAYTAAMPSRMLRLRKLHAGAILIGPAVLVLFALRDLWLGAVETWQWQLALAGYFLTMLGITVGYHRLLAHRAFATSATVTSILIIFAGMAAQGSAVYWVSNHRRHHQCAERIGDPHSPHISGTQSLHGWRGFWHAHVGWSFSHDLTSPTRYAPDLLQHPAVRWTNRRYFWWVALGLIAAVLSGALIERSWRGAWCGLVWGAGVRLFLSYHMTGAINSITHLFGYRPFATPDRSRNNFWLGIPTLGESWHNNHHAYPRAAFFGQDWWEVDLGGLLIRVLRALGLVWGVRE